MQPYNAPALIQLKCPRGHKWKTQKLPGRKARCQRCWLEHGREVLVTVPQPRPPQAR